MIRTRKTKSARLPVRQKVRTAYFIGAEKKENLAAEYFQHIRCKMFYVRQILSITANQVSISDHYVLIMRMCKILVKIRQTITDFYWMMDDANQTITDLDQTLSILNTILFSSTCPRKDSKGQNDKNENGHLLN